MLSDDTTSTFQLCGFTDTKPFHIFITRAQAQWFIYWSPQIIQNLNEGTLGSKLLEIQKNGMADSSQNSLAWFDQSYSSSSRSSASTKLSNPGFFQPKAYGLSKNTVVEAEQEQGSNCMLM